MIHDTHIHTGFSYDSQMKIAEVCGKLRETGMGATVTEHIDLNYPDPAAFKLDVQGYFTEYDKYRCDRLLLGVEIGMDVSDTAVYRRMIEEYPFDYVLGSMHVVDGVDLYDEDFYTGGTKQAVYARYFAAIRECLQVYDYIDSMGHLDYIARYARFDDREIYYKDFADDIDQILSTLAIRGKCLELNTRRLGDAHAAAGLLPIYRRFHELGGRWITIGSDAHKAADIGSHFAVAQEIAEACGLRPVYFNRREMQYL